jgi:hypothetical protein
MRRHLPRGRGLFLAVVLAASFAGVAAAAPAGAASGGTAARSPARAAAVAASGKRVSTAAPLGAGEDPLRNIPEHVQEIAAQAYPDTFGGLVMTQRATHMDVYLTRLSASIEHRLAADASAGTITFVHSAHSLKFLNALHQKVTSQYRALKAAGIKLAEWAPEIQASRELIGVSNLTPARARILDRRFGAGNIRLQSMPHFGLGLSATDRAYDQAPWNSGDFITDDIDSGDGCTAGFGVTINGYDGQITADHCFAYQADIYNYDTECVCGSKTLMGHISQNDNTTDGSDTEIIQTTNGGSSALMFDGNPGTESSDIIDGWADNPVGDYVCNSGAYSGTVCGIQIKNNNTCVTETESGRVVCHLIWALSYDNTIANETGDSGGPVYRVINGDVYAVGTTVGYKETGSSPTSPPTYPVACQYNKAQTCTADIFYNAIDYVLSAYKATLISG